MEKPDLIKKTRRQLQTEQTKDRLFEAAVSLLEEADFEQITIRDIVAKANVSIGTFYNYYTTKMGVFYETYRVADRYFTETVAPMLTQSSAHDRIQCFFHQYAHYCSELTDMKMTRLLYNPDNSWFNRDSAQGMVGVLTGLIREGLAQGQLVGEDSDEEVATFLMIAVRGLVYHWCTSSGSYDLTSATETFVERLLHAYLPNPG